MCKMAEIQINVNGKKTTNEDYFLLKYEGPSFHNKMELHAFTKQICSVETLLKESINQLNESKKIQDKQDEIKYYVEIRPGSFETNILICFLHPTILNIISDFVVDYFKYLTTGIFGERYNKEINNISQIRGVRNATKNIINPCIKDSDRVTIINGDVSQNIFIIEREKMEEIKNTLNKIEKDLPNKEIEMELFGEILKIDATNAKDNLEDSKLWFVIEKENPSPVEIIFENKPSEEELMKILFKRIKINARIYYKGDEMNKIEVLSYNPSPTKRLDYYIK